MIKTALIALAAVALAGAARAEVVDASVQGFEVRQSVTIAASAAKVWSALVQPGQWWDAKHTWSHDPHNLAIDLRPGGCWCETLPGGGGVQHLTIIYLDPGKAIRFQGGLGPFQFTGADGRMGWSLAEKDGQTTLTWTYDVGGYVKGGVQSLAAPVDGVLAEQIGRLKAFVETGKPG